MWERGAGRRGSHGKVDGISIQIQTKGGEEGQKDAIQEEIESNKHSRKKVVFSQIGVNHRVTRE